MSQRVPQDWENLEQELYAAGVDPSVIEAGARRMLAETRGHQLTETRKQLGLTQRTSPPPRASASPASPKSNTAK